MINYDGDTLCCIFADGRVICVIEQNGLCNRTESLSCLHLMALVHSAEINIEHVRMQKELNVVNEHRDDNAGP